MLDIKYCFLIDETLYHCNVPDEITKILEENQLSEIDNLKIQCQNAKDQTFQISFNNELLFQTCVIRQSCKNAILRCLATEVLQIVHKHNQFCFKKIIMLFQHLSNFAYYFLILNFAVWLFRGTFSEKIRFYFDFYACFVFFPIALCLFFINFYKFKVRILNENNKSLSFLENYSIKDKFINALIIILLGWILNFIVQF